MYSTLFISNVVCFKVGDVFNTVSVSIPRLILSAFVLILQDQLCLTYYVNVWVFGCPWIRISNRPHTTAEMNKLQWDHNDEVRIVKLRNHKNYS